MGDPITLLIYLLVAVIIVAIIWYVMGLTSIPNPLRTIILLVVILIVLLWLAGRAGMF